MNEDVTLAAPREELSIRRSLRPGHILAGAMSIAPTLAAITPLALAPLFAALVVAAAGLHIIQRRSWPRLGRWTLILACSFVGWAAVSILWSAAVPETARFAPRLAVNVVGAILLVLVVRAMPEAERRLADRWLVGGFVIGVVFFCIESTTNGTIATALNWIVLGTDRQFQYGSLSRGAAFFAIFGFLAALAARRQYGIVSALLVLAVAIFTTFMVHGYKALGGAGVGIVAIGGAMVLHRRVLPIAIVVLSAWIMTAPLQIVALDFIPGPWHQSANASVSHRLIIWRFVSERIADRPLQGWGLNSSRAIPGGHEGPVTGTEVLPLHPHNGPLQVWLELGGIGALLLALSATGGILSLRRGFSERLELGLALGAIGAGASVAAVGYGLWQGWWLATIWLSIAALASLSSVTHKPQLSDQV